MKQKIAKLVGQASMCWENPSGAGQFDSEKAKKIADELVETIKKEILEYKLKKADWQDDRFFVLQNDLFMRIQQVIVEEVIDKKMDTEAKVI